jgi:hypothetical protein
MPARECPWTKNGVREIVTGTLPAERPRHSELLQSSTTGFACSRFVT